MNSPIDFGDCLCGGCPLFVKVPCPRVSEDGKEMCLQFKGSQPSFDVYNWIYKWCGSAYCMASNDHPDGVCACQVDASGEYSFYMENMQPCSREHCPILKSFQAAQSYASNSKKLLDENKIINLYNKFIYNDRVDSVTASGAREFRDFIIQYFQSDV